MPRLAANLSFLFTELPLLDRIGAAAAAGFRGAEILFPYESGLEDLRAAFREARIEPVLFNTPAGDWASGERGFAAIPGCETLFSAHLERAKSYALFIGCKRLHVMAGIPPDDADTADCEAVFVENLKMAATDAASHGITITIEPINPIDVPGYFLTRQDQAVCILDAVGLPNVALQMDFYHCARVEGDPAGCFRQNVDRIGHIQIAGVPDRHEPDTGDLDYKPLFALIDEMGYDGWVSCEYHPAGGTLAGLGWARDWGINAG
ncbi:MAG: TIM barrel protein [Rhodospirillales bacterium]|nr:MAG: TIM barrel protein [Rhodospirillales bacterium]